MDSELERIKQEKIKRITEAMARKVIVYSTPTCPYCTMAKDYLTSRNVKFEDVDASRDQARAQEMINKSGQMGVPVLDINGKILVGFNKQAIDSALEAK